jgi:hypothetical protein
VTAETSDFKGLHTSVTGAEAIDDHTVHIKLSGPGPLYVQNLTNFFIMDKGWIEANGVQQPQDFKAGEEKFTVRNTNGTGPYILESRDPEVKHRPQGQPEPLGARPAGDRDHLYARSRKPRPALPPCCRARSISCRTSPCRTSSACRRPPGSR